jgi:hypothetical protein
VLLPFSDFKTTEYEQHPVAESNEQQSVVSLSAESQSPVTGTKRPREEEQDEEEVKKAMLAAAEPPLQNSRPSSASAPTRSISNGAVGMVEQAIPNAAPSNGQGSVGSDALYIGDLQWVSSSAYRLSMYSNSQCNCFPFRACFNSGLQTKIFDRLRFRWA